jgi:hypothetical protein
VTREGAGARPEAASRANAEQIVVERRWPVALAVGFFVAVSITLRITVPDRESLGPEWLVPGVEIGLLACLVTFDPARVAGRRRWLRPISIGLVLALAAATLVSTGILIKDLIQGAR